MIVLLVKVSQMKVDTLRQKLQQVVELGGHKLKNVAAIALSLMFTALACRVSGNIHIVHISASDDARDALVYGRSCTESTNLQGSRLLQWLHIELWKHSGSNLCYSQHDHSAVCCSGLSAT